MQKRGKKAAIELSIGTIVIVVLAMSMLILGIILVRNIFSGTTEAVDSINKGVINEINNMFTKSDAKLGIAPSTRSITLVQGDQAKGFAFSVRNNDLATQRFTWAVNLDEDYNIRTKCPGLTARDANSWLIIGEGSFSLAGGAKMENPELVKFTVPEAAPPCVLPYKIEIKVGSTLYVSDKVYVTIQGK
jgi:hypothetical protein